MNLVVGSVTLSEAFVATKRHEDLLAGRIGSLYGVQIFTDAFHPAQSRVLDRGEMFLVPKPEVLGKLLVRRALETEPCESFILGSHRIGWAMHEIIAPVVIDARLVVCMEA
jgi:hypothetical protein